MTKLECIFKDENEQKIYKSFYGEDAQIQALKYLQKNLNHKVVSAEEFTI
jgi:hypothetical protein